MKQLEIVVSPGSVVLRVNGELLCQKIGRKGWRNANGERFEFRRFPKKVRDYVNCAIYNHRVNSYEVQK